MKKLNWIWLFSLAVLLIGISSCAEQQQEELTLDGIDYEIIELDENQPHYRTDDPYDPTTDPAFICHKGSFFLDKNCNGKTDGVINYFEFGIVWNCWVKRQEVLDFIEFQGWCYEESSSVCYQSNCWH